MKTAFKQLSEGANSVSLESLVSKYHAPAHPRVTSREKQATTVFNDYVELMKEYAAGGAVTEASFIGYYADCNAVLPNERENYFIDMVLKTWGINADKAKVPANRIRELVDIIFEKIRQRTHGADDEGKAVRRIFKHFDLDGYGTIDFNEFRKALETIGCTFVSYELEALFRHFDKDSNGRVDYEEFANQFAIRGSGNNPNVNPSFGLSREQPNQVLDKILKTLK